MIGTAVRKVTRGCRKQGAARERRERTVGGRKTSKRSGRVGPPCYRKSVSRRRRRRRRAAGREISWPDRKKEGVVIKCGQQRRGGGRDGRRATERVRGGTVAPVRVSYGRAAGTERSAAKRDRPGCADAQNLQLYRKKGAECPGQTASWPVNNAAK